MVSSSCSTTIRVLPSDAQAGQGLDEPAVVALVQADGRLVEHVEHADQAGADLRGQADALGLAAGQRSRRALEVQVLQADVEQEAQACLDFLQHLGGDLRLAAGEHQVFEELGAFAHRHRRHRGDRLVVDQHGQRGRIQACTVAFGARNLPHVLLVPVARVLRFGFQVLAVDVLHHALEARGVLALAPEAVLVLHHDLVVLAVHDGGAGHGRQLVPRGLKREVQFGPEALEQPVPVLGGCGTQRPGRDGALPQRHLHVGNDQVFVDLQPGADAAAGRAGTERVVEGEGPRFDLVDGQRVLVRAREVFGEGADPALVFRVEIHEVDQHAPLGEAERGFDGVGQALADRVVDGEAVDDDLDGVLELLAELRRFAELDRLAVDTCTRVALGAQFLEEVDELALASADHRRKHLESGLRFEFQQLVDDLLWRLLGDGLAALGAVRHDPRVPRAGACSRRSR